jgi:GNAT superfamily N-acetyltransferase
VTEALDLQWREMRDEDRNYVLSSWLRSYADSSEFRHLARGVYFALYEPVVKQLLKRSTVAVAYTADLPDSILGWLAVEGDIVHYALVKPRWRKLGIGRWMTQDLKDMPAVYTHAPTLAGSRLVGDAWTYQPMRRFEKKVS